MVQNDEIRGNLRHLAQRIASAGDANELIPGQSFFVDLVLEVVIFDYQNRCRVHTVSTLREEVRTGKNSLKVLPWSTTESTARPAPKRLASSYTIESPRPVPRRVEKAFVVKKGS